MADTTLETQSLWYEYKDRVWSEESEQSLVVHNIMRVLRAIHNVGRLAYVSVPITSGRFLYELKLNRPLMSKEAYIRMAIEHNYKAGWDFVDRLSERLSFPILYPADLTPVHQEWEQAHFQALWLSIIAEKCTELHMSEGWEYSNGGVEELTHAWQLKLGLPKHQKLLFYNTKETEETERKRMRSMVIYDHEGHPIALDTAIKMVEQALNWIYDHKFRAEKIERCYRLLQQTRGLLDEGFYQ